MRADQSFSYGKPCRDPDEPIRLRPIMFDPKHRWFFVCRDIKDGYARAMETIDTAIWDAQETLRRSITAGSSHE